MDARPFREGRRDPESGNGAGRCQYARDREPGCGDPGTWPLRGGGCDGEQNHRYDEDRRSRPGEERIGRGAADHHGDHGQPRGQVDSSDTMEDRVSHPEPRVRRPLPVAVWCGRIGPVVGDACRAPFPLLVHPRRAQPSITGEEEQFQPAADAKRGKVRLG